MRLIDADVLISELKESALHHCNNPREDSLLQRDRVIVRAQPTVEAIPKDQINKAIEKIEQYICDVETDTVKAQGMAQALDMFEQALGEAEDGNDTK